MSFNINNVNDIYNVGIYIRLSREDEDKKIESESITNQRSLLLQYVKENNYRLVDIYIDDGFSGTNFNRPEFNRLLNDIEVGRINMVITKDLSRLGRDYIGTGEFVEKYFPEHNVRYVAVVDNMDTLIDGSNNDIAPFKAVMNDMYAKDISKKIRSSLRAKQKEGKFVGSRCPFGYMRDSKDKNHLVINKEQAEVVRRIFDMSLSGLSFYKIALKLTEEKVKTPAQYYSFEWKNNYKLNYGVWNAKTIRDILTNRMYVGDMVQNKRNKINYKVKKVIRNNPKDYVIVENMHEPIIDRETFFEVQKRIPKNVGRIEKKENHLLDGLLYCGDCGHRISVTPRRRKDNKCYTICNYYRTYRKKKICTTHSNNYDILEKVIIDSIRKECKIYIDKKKIIDRLNDNFLKVDSSIKIKTEKKNILNELNKCISNLDDIYIDKLNNKIDEDQYLRIKEKLEKSICLKKKKIENLDKLLLSNTCVSKDRWKVENYIKEVLSLNNLSRECIINLVERIEIFDDKRINVKFSFNIV